MQGDYSKCVKHNNDAKTTKYNLFRLTKIHPVHLKLIWSVLLLESLQSCLVTYLHDDDSKNSYKTNNSQRQHFHSIIF